jgi:hypothetical protein
VIGAICRKGNVVARVLNRVNSAAVESFVREAVSNKCSLLSTDTAILYHHFGEEYPHGMVNHTRKQYVVGAIHTNTIEGFWSLIKRGVRGSYHKVTHASTRLQHYGVISVRGGTVSFALSAHRANRFLPGLFP